MLIRNRPKLFALGLMGILAIAAVACGTDSPAAQSAAEATSTPAPTTTPQSSATPIVRATEEPHDHATHEHGPVDSTGVSVDLNLFVDAVTGVNVQIVPTGFEFTPENVNQDHIDGEGHAHVFVDGVKLGRVYTPWIHIPGLAPGEHNIAVTLNANTHAEYTSSGAPVLISKVVTIPEPDANDDHAMHPDGQEAARQLSVSVIAEPDAIAGANVSISVDGFVFTPEDVNQDHVDGQGHAHVYVDGKKIGRVYGPSIHLGTLSEGDHEIRVTLNANTHADYMLDGQVVEAVTTVHVIHGGKVMDDDHDDDHMTDDDQMHDDARHEEEHEDEHHDDDATPSS